MKHVPKLLISINSLIFLLILFGLGAVNLFGSHGAAMSEMEQRDLAEKPAFSWVGLFKGKYTRELDNYFSDHFAFRSQLVQVGAELKGLKSLPDTNGATIVEQKGDNTDSSQSVTGKDSVKYLIFDNRAVMLFSYSAEAAKQFAASLNRFRKSVDPQVRIYSMIAPSSAAFVDNAKYRDMSDSLKEAFASINKQLSGGITPVNAYKALESHQKEYIHFRTDHHWTALGAYYAYSELMKQLGEKPVALSHYKKGTIKGFLGSTYKATLSSVLKANPDTIDYYVPKDGYEYTVRTTTGKNATRRVVDPRYAEAGNGFYAVFLGGDFPLGTIKTGQKNGKRLVVVKDSYANALIPFLLPHFEEINVIDPRFYKGNLKDFVKDRKITDVLFMNSSSAARNTGWSQLLNEKLGMAASS